MFRATAIGAGRVSTGPCLRPARSSGVYSRRNLADRSSLRSPEKHRRPRIDLYKRNQQRCAPIARASNKISAGRAPLRQRLRWFVLDRLEDLDKFTQQVFSLLAASPLGFVASRSVLPLWRVIFNALVMVHYDYAYFKAYRTDIRRVWEVKKRYPLAYLDKAPFYVTMFLLGSCYQLLVPRTLLHSLIIPGVSGLFLWPRWRTSPFIHSAFFCSAVKFLSAPRGWWLISPYKF